MNWLDSLKYVIESVFKKIKKKPPIPTEVKEVVVKKSRIQLDLDPDYGWQGIVWHHSATSDTNYDDWSGIKKYHTSYRIRGHIVDKKTFTAARKNGEKGLQRPWSDIGYHGGVEKVDGVYTHRTGRSLDRAGAHAAVAKVSNSYNKTHIGLCLIGNFDLEAPNQEVWEFCLAVTRTYMDTYDIDKDMVIGHREVYDKLGIFRQKTCPGNLFDIHKFRSDL